MHKKMHIMIKRMGTINTTMSKSRYSSSILIKKVTMTTTTMENRCLVIVKAALTIKRQPPLSTEKVILSKTANMRRNQLRRLTKNMKLQQGPITNQINTLSLGAILQTPTEEQEIMKLMLTLSIKGKNLILNYT